MKTKSLIRFAAVAMVGALGATSVAGCGAAGSSTASDDKTLSLWTWTSGGELLQAAVDGFEKDNPGTTVEIVDVGNPAIWDKITAGLAAGGEGLPDIMNTSIEYIPGWTDKFPNAFVDMGPMGAEKLAEDFAPVAWGGGVGDGGEVWGVPFEVNTAGFAYNADLFDQAGVDMSTIATWDELIAAGVVLKEKTGADLVELNKAAQGSSAADFWQTLTQQQGGWYFNDDGDITLNGAEGVRSLTLLKKMHDAGILADTASFAQGDYGGEFADGSVAVNVDASWWPGFFAGAFPDQAGTWAVRQRPAFEQGGTTATLAGSTYLSISGASENKELAWEFINFALGSLDGQAAMQAAHTFTPGYLPMYETDGFTDEVEFFVSDSPAQIFVDAITQPDIAVSNYTADYGRAIQLMTDAQTKVMLSGADPKEALDEAAQLLADQTGREIAN